MEPADPSLRHFYISLCKSMLRICCGLVLIKGNLFGAGMLLISAEVLGILEEL